MKQFETIENYLQNTFVKEKKVPGCDVIIMQDHKTLHRFSCGFSDGEKTVPVSENDLYFLYSCTKPVTVAAAMRLVEQGKIGLDTPVSKYLPAYKDVYLLRDGKRAKPENTMTVRHLFTMTAGLDYNLRKPATVEVMNEYGDNASTRQIVDSFAKEPFCFSPGERFEYSLCHDVLAAVVEEAAGKKFSEYVAEAVFNPLGMENTTFHPDEEQYSHIAAQYLYENNIVRQIDKSNGFIFSSNYDSGGAGLVSCVNDYIKFADTMACGGISADGYRLLKPESIHMIQAEQLPAITVNPDFPCVPGQGYGYGLGVRTRITEKGGKSPLGEFGWDGAAGSYVLIDPQNKLSIFFAMQVHNWPSLIGGHGNIRDLTYEALL